MNGVNENLQPDCTVMDCGYRKAHPNLRKEYDELEADYDEIASKLEEMETLLTDDKENTPTEKKKLNGKILGLNRKNALQETKIKKLEKAYDNMEAAYKNMEQAYKTEQIKNSEIKTEYEHNEEINTLKATKNILTEEINDLEVNKKTLELKNNVLNTQLLEDQGDYDSLIRVYNETVEAYKNAKENYEALRKEVNKFDKKTAKNLFKDIEIPKPPKKASKWKFWRKNK